MRSGRFLYILVLLLLFAAYCRSADRQTQICEPNITECQQNCANSNANFTNTRLPTQPVGPCDVRCEQNYQACLKRQSDKKVRIVGNP